MVVLDIVRRDLTRFARNPVATALMFAIPLSMSGIFALVFGASGGDQPAITIRVLLHDEDDTLLSRMIQGSGSDPEMDERLELVPVGEEGYRMMEEGEGSALLHIPEGFTDDYLEGRQVDLEVVKNPAQRFLPQVVEEGVSIGAVVLSQSSRVFRSELAQIQELRAQDEFPADSLIGALSVGINQKLRGLETYLLPPIVDLETVTLTAEGEEDEEGFNILSYFLPGFSIFGILFFAQAATRDVLRERESGLLRHLLTAPVSVGQYLVGKCLSTFVVTTLGFAVLIVVGIAAGVAWGTPPAAAALVLTSSLAAAGAMLLIMSLVGSQRQGDALTTIVIIVWCMVGGAFVPLSQMPGFLLPISRATPTYWAIDGFVTLIQHGGGLNDIALNVLILGIAGLVMLVAGSFVLRRRILSGAV
jgi:ABC-2 type transport system permease protein